MKQKSGSPLGLYTIGIAALFLAGFLFLVIFGAYTYKDVEVVQAGNNEARSLLSYLSTCVHNSDRAGNISILDGEYGTVLAITDGSGYVLSIYQQDGKLLEEYKAADTDLDPEFADVLGETAVFQVETLKEDTLRIATDAGDVLLYLRSGEASE